MKKRNTKVCLATKAFEVMMMTEEEFENLKQGDKVYKVKRRRKVIEYEVDEVYPTGLIKIKNHKYLSDYEDYETIRMKAFEAGILWKMDPKDFKNKFVKVILKNDELLIGQLKKVPLLPLWKIENRYFSRRRISKIYLAKE